MSQDESWLLPNAEIGGISDDLFRIGTVMTIGWNLGLVITGQRV